MKSYAGTNYLSPRCRPVSSLGYVEAKNRTAASLTGANNKQMYLSPHLEECVCACVRACGSERKVAVLVPIGPRWRFIQNDRQDPYAGVLSKRPARSLFGHTSHLTALRHRRVHVWMQVQHLLYTSEEHQYTRSLIWWLSIRQPKQYTSSLYPRQSIIACIDLRRYKWFTSSH